jgi:hypothetical protein
MLIKMVDWERIRQEFSEGEKAILNKDYDGRLISISCRYWPGPDGGGSLTFDTATQKMGTLPYGQTPSAHAAIHLDCGTPDDCGYGDYLTLAEKEFTGPTEADVKRQVEEWVKQKFDQISSLVSHLD